MNRVQHCASMHEASPRTKVQLRLPPDLDDWLAGEARRRMVSKTRLVEYALEEFRISIGKAEADGRIVALADLYAEARA